MAIGNTYLCVAHGGAAAACPPGHTMEALRKAIEIGASMLYVEIRVTRDQEMVAWPSLQRVVAGEVRYLADHSLDEWRRITEKEPSPIVTLDDVMDLADQTHCGLAIDVRVPNIENALARKLRSGGLPYETLLVVIAQENSRLVMRSLDPRIPIAHRFNMEHQAKITPELIKNIDADAVIWPGAALTRGVTKALKGSGIAVYGGPVNLAQDMRRLRDECGVDGILTAYPELMMSLLEKDQPGRRAA